MGRPTFIVAGAPRSGTTSLYYYSASHPHIHVSPVKETNYLLYRSPARSDLDLLGAADLDRLAVAAVRSEAEYERLFTEPMPGSASGEFSPAYLQNPSTAETMRSYLPGVKVVFILRNPVERAFSHFMQHRRTGMWGDHDFLALCKRVLLQGEDVKSVGARYPARLYFQTGSYARRVSRFIAVLGRPNVLVRTYEELESDARGFLREFFDFVGVSSGDETLDKVDTSIRHNASGAPRSVWQDSLFAVPTRSKYFKRWVKERLPARVWQPLVRMRNRLQSENLERLEVPSAAVHLLKEYYKDDVSSLSSIVGCDLTSWMEGRSASG